MSSDVQRVGVALLFMIVAALLAFAGPAAAPGGEAGPVSASDAHAAAGELAEG